MRGVWLAWGIYLAAGVVWFLVAETIALRNRVPGDTLSEVVWSLRLPPVVWFLGAGLTLGLTVWLVIHFASGGKWGL